MSGAGSGPPSVRLRTFGRLFNFPRYLHNLGKLRLSVTGPISYRLMGYGLVVFAPLYGLFWLLGVGWVGPEMVLRLLLPGLLVRWALGHAELGGRPGEAAVGLLRFGVSAGRGWRRSFAGGRPVRVRGRVRVLEGDG